MGAKTRKLSQINDSLIEWQSVVVADGSTGLTAVAGRGYFINTTSGTITVTLPSATAKPGDIIQLKDYARTWGTNAVSIASNLFDGTTNANTFSTNGQTVTLIYMDNIKGWSLINEDTTSSLAALFVAATGGTVTTSGDYKIHSFTGDGCFVVSSAGNAAGSNTVQTLIVAGGGGGGRDRGAGGGAGGLILTPSAGIPVSATTYPISIGGGGNGGTSPSNCGVQGTPSTGFSLTAVGGGKGSRGGGGAPISTTTGGPGGSGGGGSVGCTSPSIGAGGPGTQPTQPGNSGAYGFGNNGGAGNPSYPTGTGNTGGGGGANAVGVSGSSTTSGAGGAGKDVTPIFGAAPQSFYGPTDGIYAGGGGGGMSSGSPGPNTGGLGGSGGGGSGGKSPANGPGPGVGEAGTTNTGGGGGGGANTTPSQCGGNGGKGVVIIRYKFQ